MKGASCVFPFSQERGYFSRERPWKGMFCVKQIIIYRRMGRVHFFLGGHTYFARIVNPCPNFPSPAEWGGGGGGGEESCTFFFFCPCARRCINIYSSIGVGVGRGTWEILWPAKKIIVIKDLLESLPKFYPHFAWICPNITQLYTLAIFFWFFFFFLGGHSAPSIPPSHTPIFANVTNSQNGGRGRYLC